MIVQFSPDGIPKLKAEAKFSSDDKKAKGTAKASKALEKKGIFEYITAGPHGEGLQYLLDKIKGE